MSGFEKTAAEVVGGTVHNITIAPASMSNTATKLRALERFVIELAVEQGVLRAAAEFGTLGRDMEAVRADLRRVAEQHLADLQQEEAIPLPPPGGR